MAVAPINILVTLAPNPDGSLSTANAQGDASPDPSVLSVNRPALIAALGSLLGLTTGAPALSFNLRNVAWLSGTEEGTCTFALVTVSGDTASAKNWSISGSTLAQPLTSTSSDGAGVFELRAISSTGGVLSLALCSWSILEPSVGADVLAPTVPLGLTITPGQNVLNCTCDPSADNYDNTTAPSGLDHYAVTLDGVANQVVAAVKNPALQMQVTNIGPITSPAAPAAVSMSGVVTLNAAGAGIHGVTADQCVFYNAPLTGDFTLTALLGAFDSPYQYSTSGIMIRETLDPASIMTALYVQSQTPGNGAQLKQRSNTGSTSGNVATVTGYESGYARYVRVGATITSFLSADGINFAPVGTQNLPMAAQVFVGAFLSSQQAGTSVTSTVAQINVATAPKVSFSITTTGTHSVAVAAVDTNGNASQPGPSVIATASGTVIIPPTQGKIRNHGGIYIYLDRNTSIASKLSRMAYFAQFPFVRGFQDIVFQSTFENPNASAPGDYSGSWDASGHSGVGYVQTMLNQCFAVRPSDPMRMMFHSSTYGFAGQNKSATNFPAFFVPKYLQGAAYGPSNAVEATGVWGGVWINTATQTTKNGGPAGYFTRWWVPAVMDSMLQMIAYYGSILDNPDPTKNIAHADLCEMVSFIGESTIPLYTTYSDAAGIAQYQRYMPGCRTRFPSTQLRWWGSWLQDQSLVKQVIDLCAASFWAIGGPDCVNETGTGSRVFAANKAYRGINPVTSVTDPSYINYVNRLAWVSEFEPDEQGPRNAGSSANPTGAGNAALGNNNWPDYIAQGAQQGANYVTMFDNGYTGNNDKRLSNLLSSQPAHPSGIDALQSLGTTGLPVNGSVAMGLLPNFNRYPTGFPT